VKRWLGKEAQSFSGKLVKKAANAWQNNGAQSFIGRLDAKAAKVGAIKVNYLEQRVAQVDRRGHSAVGVISVQTRMRKNPFLLFKSLFSYSKLEIFFTPIFRV
jgi:hypothetical protein